MNIEKTDKLKWIFILLSILNPFWGYSQKKCTEKEIFNPFVIDLKLPCNYKKNTLNYEEGKFVDYNYPDSSTITIFSGAMQKLPLLSIDFGYFPQHIDTLPDRIVTRGIKNGTYWREDIIGKIRILYDRVSNENKEKFDAILDSICIKKK